MNKTVDGKQCTIFWHMYDIKILHVIPEVVYGVLLQLITNYGNVSELSVSRGCMHE